MEHRRAEDYDPDFKFALSILSWFALLVTLAAIFLSAYYATVSFKALNANVIRLQIKVDTLASTLNQPALKSFIKSFDDLSENPNSKRELKRLGEIEPKTQKTNQPIHTK